MDGVLLQSRVKKLGPLVERMLQAFLIVVGSGVLKSPSKAGNMRLVADANGFVKLLFKLFKFVVLML
jgi:hypothetical protein